MESTQNPCFSFFLLPVFFSLLLLPCQKYEDHIFMLRSFAHAFRNMFPVVQHLAGVMQALAQQPNPQHHLSQVTCGLANVAGLLIDALVVLVGHSYGLLHMPSTERRASSSASFLISTMQQEPKASRDRAWHNPSCPEAQIAYAFIRAWEEPTINAARLFKPTTLHVPWPQVLHKYFCFGCAVCRCVVFVSRSEQCSAGAPLGRRPTTT